MTNVVTHRELWQDKMVDAYCSNYEIVVIYKLESCVHTSFI